MDLDSLIQTLSTELTKTKIKVEDTGTGLLYDLNEFALQGIPVQDRPVDQQWNDHLMEYLERDMWNKIFTDKQPKKKGPELK